MSRFTALVAILILVLSSLTSIGATTGASRAAIPSGQTSSANCEKPNDPGLIVFLDLEDRLATPEVEGVETWLVVYRPDGSVLHRLPLSTFPSPNVPLSGCTVLLNDTDDGSVVFNAASGDLLPLRLPDTYGDDAVFPFTGWQRTFDERRFAILSDGRPNHVLLADIQSGQTTDLAALVQQLRGEDSQMVVFVGAALSADESTLLLMADRDTWIVPTGDPAGARMVGDAAPGRASLSQDGSRVLFTTRSETEPSKVLIENIDGTERIVVAEGGELPLASWVPGTGGNQILIVQTIEQTLSVVDLAEGSEMDLVGLLPSTPSDRPIFSPSGRRALLRTSGEETEWAYIDLDLGTAGVVESLRGYPFPYNRPAPGVRWITFFPSDRPSVEPGDSMRSIELETGEVSAPLTFEFEETYYGIQPFSGTPSSPDGRYTIVNDVGRGYPRFWLLDAQTGTSTTHDGRIATAFSPDGLQLLVGEPAGGENTRVWRTLIMTVKGEDVRTLTESLGRGGFWVPSPYARAGSSG